jgi:hypothetical protein
MLLAQDKVPAVQPHDRARPSTSPMKTPAASSGGLRDDGSKHQSIAPRDSSSSTGSARPETPIDPDDQGGTRHHP